LTGTWLTGIGGSVKGIVEESTMLFSRSTKPIYIKYVSKYSISKFIFKPQNHILDEKEEIFRVMTGNIHRRVITDQILGIIEACDTNWASSCLDIRDAVHDKVEHIKKFGNRKPKDRSTQENILLRVQRRQDQELAATRDAQKKASSP
jgi:hypothetical protein